MCLKNCPQYCGRLDTMLGILLQNIEYNAPQYWVYLISRFCLLYSFIFVMSNKQLIYFTFFVHNIRFSSKQATTSDGKRLSEITGRDYCWHVLWTFACRASRLQESYNRDEAAFQRALAPTNSIIRLSSRYESLVYLGTVLK